MTQKRQRIGTHNGVRFEVWTFDPETSAKMLEKVHNRPVRVSRVDKYGRTMADERWVLNYEWIGIDEHGYVTEGQHRLRACVQSGASFRSLVLIGLPRSLFPSLGTAAPRGAADSLALVGTANANGVAAALPYLWRAERGMTLYATGAGARPDNDEALGVLSRHPGIEESYRRARTCLRVYPHVPMLAYLHYEASKIDQVVVDLFVEKLARGAGLRETDPAYALRERMIANKVGQQRLTQKYVLAITIKALNYALAKRPSPKFLRWRENEPFPVLGC